MFASELLGWWYTRGWKDKLQSSGASLFKTADFFSISLLLQTLFAPFRQISAQTGINRSLGDKFRAWGDKMFSRLVGFVMRSFMILFGIVVLIVEIIYLTVQLVLWPFMPIVPLIGIVLWLSGVKL